MALIHKYQAHVEEIINPFEGIYVVSFKCTEKKFKYLPGQFLHIALDEYDPSRQWPESRCFSMQSNQEDKLLKIVYAVKGHFTQRMEKELHVGKKVWLKMPYGDLFSRHHPIESCIFIAGGTGITPFLSLFTSKEYNCYKNPYLYLGVRSENYNIYQDEINKATLINESFSYKIKVQDKEGLLDISEIFANHNKESVYFISGPPVMIKNFKTFLIDKGVMANNILTDDWE